MHKYQVGFTIIELMVTLVVLAIVVAVAIPGFNTLIQNNRSVALAEEFITALNFARAEAIKRGGRVAICASDTGTSCEGDWTDGWIVIVDGALTDNANTAEIAGADEDNILRSWGEFDLQSAIVEANNKKFIRFTGTGALGRVDNNPVVLTTSIKSCSGLSARRITIGLSGGLNVARAQCATQDAENE